MAWTKKENRKFIQNQIEFTRMKLESLQNELSWWEGQLEEME